MTILPASRGFVIASPRFLWAFGYILVNIIAFVQICITQTLMGDSDGLPVTDFLLLNFAILAVVGSILLLLALFNWFHSLQIPVPEMAVPQRPLLLLYIALLLFFIGYVAVTGLFVAGSAKRGGDLFSALFVILNVDTLFLLMFATCRDSKLYLVMAPIYVVSIVQRGWFALLFMFIVLESFRFLRLGLVRWWHLAGLAVFMAAYPIVDAAKVYIRINDGFELSGFVAFVSAAVQVVDVDTQTSLALAFEKIVGRLQTVSPAYLIFDQLAYFDVMRARGVSGNFWSEGILGVIADAVTNALRLQEGPQTLATLIAPDLDSSWNVNPSLVGWLGIYGAMAPLAALYVLMLAFLSHVLMKVVANTENGRDALWYIWLLLIIPGWIAQFVSFIWGLVVFICLVWTLRAFDRLTRPSRLGRGASKATSRIVA